MKKISLGLISCDSLFCHVEPRFRFVDAAAEKKQRRVKQPTNTEAIVYSTTRAAYDSNQQ